MSQSSQFLTILVSAIGTPLFLHVLSRIFRPASNTTLFSDSQIIERNKSAYNIVTMLFLMGLLSPLPFYKLLEISENDARPIALGWSFSVVAPLVFLQVRRMRGGPSIEELIRYGEIKDGISRIGQLLLFGFWLMFALVALGFGVYQQA